MTSAEKKEMKIVDEGEESDSDDSLDLLDDDLYTKRIGDLAATHALNETLTTLCFNADQNKAIYTKIADGVENPMKMDLDEVEAQINTLMD